MSRAPGTSCFDPRMILLSLVVALVIVGAAVLSKGYETGSAPRLALALVQTAATTLLIVVLGLNLRKLDEMQRRIQLEALALAFAGTGIVAMGTRWFESAGLPKVDWGEWIWPVMVALWAAGFWLANRRYS